MQIQCVDGAHLEYSSFFIYGLTELGRRPGIRFGFGGGDTRRHAFDARPGRTLPALCLFEVRDGDEAFRFCIDAYDRASHLDLEALDRCRFYFKVNYCPRTIARAQTFPLNAKWKIRPVNPAFPVRVPIAPQLALSQPADLTTARYWRKAKKAVGFYWSHPSLNWITALRHRAKVQDVHFVVPWYGHKHPEVNDFRYELIVALRKERRLQVTAGFFSTRENRLPGKYRGLMVPTTSRARHLASLAASRVAVYVRGVHDCLSFKLGEQLALGLPIVGQKLRFSTNHLRHIPRFEEQFAFDSPESIVRAVVEAVRDPGRLVATAESNAQTFDHLLSPVATAEWLLSLMQSPEMPPLPSASQAIG